MYVLLTWMLGVERERRVAVSIDWIGLNIDGEADDNSLHSV